MKNILIFILISVFVILLVNSCSKKEEKPGGVSIANPASVNCINNGGKLKIMEDANGQHGICILKDGTECEEWEYFRKECSVKENNSCRQQGTDCCKGYGENITCINGEVRCAAGYEDKFLDCDLEKCMPKWDCVKMDSQQCMEKGTSCCKGTICAQTNLDCTQGYKREFLGCDLEKCMPKWDCVKA